MRKLRTLHLRNLYSCNLEWVFNSPPKSHAFVSLPLESRIGNTHLVFSYLFNSLFNKYIYIIAGYLVRKFNSTKSNIISKALVYNCNSYLGQGSQNKLLEMWYAFVIDLIILEDEILIFNYKYKNNIYFPLVVSFYYWILTIFFYKGYNDAIILLIAILAFSSILFYIRYWDKDFILKYPTLYKYLNIVCIIGIIVLTCYLIMHLHRVFIKGNAGKSSNPNPSPNNPNSSGSGGPGPGSSDTTGAAKTSSDKDKEKKEKARLYRLKNKEKIKENRKRYNDSLKGKETSKKYVSEHIEKVRETKKKHRETDKGKETREKWVENHAEDIKRISDKYRKSDKGKLTMKEYYLENKDYLDIIRKERMTKYEIKLRSAAYYDRNKEKIKKNVKAYQLAHKDEISLHKALKYALDKMEKNEAKRAEVDQEFLVDMMNSMAAAEKANNNSDSGNLN